jgi:hypothetical protein
MNLDLKIEGKTIATFVDYNIELKGFTFLNIVFLKRPSSDSSILITDSYSKIYGKDNLFK